MRKTLQPFLTKKKREKTMGFKKQKHAFDIFRFHQSHFDKRTGFFKKHFSA